MLYTPPEPWGQEGSGHLRYSVVKTRIITFDGLDFLVQQHVKDLGHPYYYTVVRGVVQSQAPMSNGNSGRVLYDLTPADRRYKPDLEKLISQNNFKGHVEFSQFNMPKF
jgi:hypothetical protein